jgi:hypothetical protein
MQEEEFTEEGAVALLHELAKDLGFDSSRWKITFDNGPNEGLLSVAEDDPLEAHIKIKPRSEESKTEGTDRWKEKWFRFAAYHELGHIKGRHITRFRRIRFIYRAWLVVAVAICVPAVAGFATHTLSVCSVLPLQDFNLLNQKKKKKKRTLGSVGRGWRSSPLLSSQVGGPTFRLKRFSSELWSCQS